MREVSPLDLIKQRVTLQRSQVAVWVTGIRLAVLNVLLAPFREAEPRPASVVGVEGLDKDPLVDELEEDLQELPLILPSNRRLASTLNGKSPLREHSSDVLLEVDEVTLPRRPAGFTMQSPPQHLTSELDQTPLDPPPAC
jgi:hypothetical protein